MEQLGLDLPDAFEEIGAIERRCLARGHRLVLGVDEVGRGPLAGPVTCAGVLLDASSVAWCEGLNDSKLLRSADREAWCPRIERLAVGFVVVHLHADEVDRLNVLGASLEGMRRCVAALRERCGDDALVLVDGNRAVPSLNVPQITLIKGDARSFAIAAASVLAKVARDRWMKHADARFPGYGFTSHKGYPTPQHREALRLLGPCAIHRRSFRPVREAARAFEEARGGE